ncbi:thiosulfate oxidation carrier complex protein SoxZ [Methylobacillus sp.]|uniref:thiosulfate oxidation carrier complex protein SoxZ n=1 Tax=Methylobacillus sp. TaxID=56818 RepID=UPI0012CEB0BE|nr:thiosulfate oxidation carrier complex protein SoxZ [Methylobacillus sp.]MPS48267.1 thiosulfate oxidation carrier complex protein SoxZ [Methylobacillus sp.]
MLRADGMTVQARLSHGVAEIVLSFSLPMEDGIRMKGAGPGVSAHFIQLVQVSHNGHQVLEAHLSTGTASDPQLVFYVAEAKAGDTVSVTWHDNKGHSGRYAMTLT